MEMGFMEDIDIESPGGSIDIQNHPTTWGGGSEKLMCQDSPHLPKTLHVARDSIIYPGTKGVYGRGRTNHRAIQMYGPKSRTSITGAAVDGFVGRCPPAGVAVGSPITPNLTTKPKAVDTTTGYYG